MAQPTLPLDGHSPRPTLTFRTPSSVHENSQEPLKPAVYVKQNHSKHPQAHPGTGIASRKQNQERLTRGGQRHSCQYLMNAARETMVSSHPQCRDALRKTVGHTCYSVKLLRQTRFQPTAAPPPSSRWALSSPVTHRTDDGRSIRVWWPCRCTSVTQTIQKHTPVQSEKQ